MFQLGTPENLAENQNKVIKFLNSKNLKNGYIEIEKEEEKKEKFEFEKDSPIEKNLESHDLDRHDFQN